MFVALIAAQSLDGFITRHDEPGTAFTSAEDKRRFPELLKSFDCSVMGGETYRSVRDELLTRRTPERLRAVLTREPERYASDAQPEALEFTREAPAELLRRLAARGRRRCALLGGGEINALFLQAGLVDELWLTLEPRLFGQGRPLVSSKIDIALRQLSIEPLTADTLLLNYAVTRSTESATRVG